MSQDRPTAPFGDDGVYAMFDLLGLTRETGYDIL